MAAVSDPELSDDGTDEPEPDVPCTSAAVAVDHDSVPSLLTRLKQAPVAAVNRKRKVAQNSSTRQRHKTPRTTHDPKGVSPEQRVREFPEEKFVVSGKKLFCTACREEVAVKKSVVELHVKSEKHKCGKGKLLSKSNREQSILQALDAYDKEVHPVGESLPGEQRIYRVKVLSTFLKAGVALNKLDVFRDLLEENGLRLAGRRPMSDLIPFVLAEEKKRLREEIGDRAVSVIFDGTSRIGEALVVVLRFIDEDWSPQQRLVRLQLLAKSMCGEEIARELITILSTELSISSRKLLAAMRDRASTNNVAMQTIKIVYPSLLDIGCYSHTIDLAGERFVTPVLEEFSKSWIGMFAHSPRARLLWREKTGRSMATFSETRWWSRWEIYKQILLYFGDILPFLQENDLSPSYRKKALAIFEDNQKNVLLQIELAVVVDAGEPFVKAT